MAIGKAGTAVHRVAEMVFTEDEDGNPRYDLNAIKYEMMNLAEYKDIIEEGAIRYLYEKLLELKDNLREAHKVKVGGEYVYPKFYPEFVITAKSNIPIDGND